MKTNLKGTFSNGKSPVDIEKEALELSLRERAVLVELVLATLNQVEDHDVKELWAEEAEKRYREHRAGKIEAKRVDNVFEQAKKRIKWARLYFSVRLSRKCLRP